MASKVSICNIALGWLGQTPISSTTEASTTAQLCNANYDDARRATLEEGIWAFAQKRFKTSITSDQDDPNRWGGNNYFPRPSGFIAIREVYDSESAEQELRGWTVEGPYIVANAETIYGVGIENVVDINRWPASVRAVLAARLAADMAVAITQSDTLQQSMTALHADKLARAVVIDGAQSRRTTMRSPGRIVTSRYRGR